jgi:hypothetical protein
MSPSSNMELCDDPIVVFGFCAFALLAKKAKPATPIIPRTTTSTTNADFFMTIQGSQERARIKIALIGY